MTRLRRYLWSLGTGYGVLVCNIAYTFLSIPLSLHYLTKAEFGLWGLLVQIMLFTQLIDAGITGASARILVEYKDRPGIFGSVLKSIGLVFFLQALIVVCVSFWAAPWMSSALNIPAELDATFQYLLIGYAASYAFAHTLRIFNQVLFAHQRVDVLNYILMAGFFLKFGALLAGYQAGWGLYSLLLSFLVMNLLNGLLPVWLSFRTGCFQRSWLRQPFSARYLKEVVFFGFDRFLVLVSIMGLRALPSILITKYLGLQANGDWTVGTRIVYLVQQILFRVYDTAYPALSEMVVRGQKKLLQVRLCRMVDIVHVMNSVFILGIFLLNTDFVSVWTAGRVSWSPRLDLLMGGWLLLHLNMKGAWTLISLTKRIGVYKWIAVLEVVGVAMAGVWLGQMGELTLFRVSLLLIGGMTLLTVPVGGVKSIQLLEMKAGPFFRESFRYSLRFSGLLLPMVWLIHHMLHADTALNTLLLRGGAFGCAVLICGWLTLRGFIRELRTRR